MSSRTNRFTGRRILITGPNGFIGKHLVRYLRKRNFLVIPWRRDVRKPICFEGLVDIVIHLAGTTRRSQFRRNARSATDVNVLGTRNALDLCRARNARMILPSTAGVYGNRSGAAAERHKPAPITPYARSKQRAEQLCRMYSQKYGVRTVILRIFNVYGPEQNREFLLPYLVHCAKHGRAAGLKNPEARRDFIHISDVASAIHAAIQAPTGRMAIYNIGSGKDVSVGEVMKKLSRMTRHPVQWKRNSWTGREIHSSRADIRKARRELRWAPRVSLTAGLRSMLSATS